MGYGSYGHSTMKLGMPILATTAHGFWMRSLDELWIQTLKTYP